MPEHVNRTSAHTGDRAADQPPTGTPGATGEDAAPAPRPSRRELREAAAHAAAPDEPAVHTADPDEPALHTADPDEPDAHTASPGEPAVHPDEAHDDGSTRAAAPPFLWIVLGAVLIAVSLAVLWGASQNDGRPDGAGASAVRGPGETGGALAGDARTPSSASETASAPAAGTPALDDAAITQAMIGLRSLPATSDCINVSADAQTVHTYADALLTDGAWPDLPTSRLIPVTLDDLAAECDADYARRLAQYLAGDPAAAPAVVDAVRGHHDAVTLARPAPDGAVADEAFRTASGNIRCTITLDGAGCAIVVRSFDNPPGCATPASEPLSVALFATDVLPCVGTVDGGTSQLAVGATSAVGDYACTNEGAAVTCWHTVSGAGFALSPEGLTEL